MRAVLQSPHVAFPVFTPLLRTSAPCRPLVVLLLLPLLLFHNAIAGGGAACN